MALPPIGRRMAMMMIAPAGSVSTAQALDTVVLLHGIGHSRWNMYGIERALRRGGYAPLSLTYPSLQKDLPALACFVHDTLVSKKIWDQSHRVHFVTHSMGGLVAQRYLGDYKSEIPPNKMGRVVMIAPPNGGSEVADLLKDFPPYHWLFGPAGQQLTTQARGAPVTPLWYETGIIAGTRGWPYFVADRLIKGTHDGRVAVEKTKLPGMKDHITLPATHSFISWKPAVHRYVIHFLKNGTFRKKTTLSQPKYF